jgi:hypothetical protein
MREILLNNKEIQERLKQFSDTFLRLKPETLEIDHRDPTIDKDYAVSNEYLKEIVDKGFKHKGPPETIKAIDLATKLSKELSPEWNEFVNDVTNNFPREMGIQQNAITGYYPEDGYIGWHSNHDAPGYTLLFNWSETGDGFYRFRDPITHKVTTIKDKPGWSCKSGYYGVRDNDDIWTYHCAYTNEPRWAIAFYIQDRNMWNMVIEEIEESSNEKFDKYLHD